MARPMMVCIERRCPGCGASNKVVTPDVRPSWTINCSSCGTVLVRRRGVFRLHLVEPALAENETRRRPPGAMTA